MDRKLIDTLKKTLDIEHLIGKCFERTSELIKNGKIKKKFLEFSRASLEAEGVLSQILNGLGEKKYFPQYECKSCKISPESFSLLGLLNLGIELNKALLRFYKELKKELSNKKILDKFLQERKKSLLFLKKERTFKDRDEAFLDFKKRCYGFSCLKPPFV